jgi:chorismate mutase-like protein
LRLETERGINPGGIIPGPNSAKAGGIISNGVDEKMERGEMEKKTRSALRKLKEKRIKIDLLDQKLLTLLNQRLRVALEVGKIKKGIGKEIYDPGREKKVLEKLKLRNRGPLKEQDLIRIFRTIMKVCRRSQT